MSGRARLWRDAHASREAVRQMHHQPEMMNDPEAKAILRLAADDLGRHLAAARTRLAQASAARAED